MPTSLPAAQCQTSRLSSTRSLLQHCQHPHALLSTVNSLSRTQCSPSMCSLSESVMRDYLRCRGKSDLKCWHRELLTACQATEVGTPGAGYWSEREGGRHLMYHLAGCDGEILPGSLTLLRYICTTDSPLPIAADTRNVHALAVCTTTASARRAQSTSLRPSRRTRRSRTSSTPLHASNPTVSSR